MNSLVTFEAAARHLNFTAAAGELNVTQAAVSRQIQLLEEHLGSSLFRRAPRKLELTREGVRLYQVVSASLEDIANVVTDLRRPRNPDEVTVASSVTFASYWLINRVAKFRAAYPEIELRLVASAPVADLAVAGIDLAVRYGDGKWPKVKAMHLLDNEVFPVCTAGYLERSAPLETASDLLSHRLLHLVEYDRNWVTWDAWFHSQGVEGKPAKRGQVFDNYLLLIQAALDGQGVALGGGRLADDHLTRGSLVRPIQESLSSDRAFYLLIPTDVPLSDPAELFREWILAEAKGEISIPAY